jgi:hypothetical protein
MKRMSLKGISEILSERELKNVMGGSEGEVNGFECRNGQCYIDVYWSNGTQECGMPMPMEVCRQKAGFSC